MLSSHKAVHLHNRFRLSTTSTVTLQTIWDWLLWELEQNNVDNLHDTSFCRQRPPTFPLDWLSLHVSHAVHEPLLECFEIWGLEEVQMRVCACTRSFAYLPSGLCSSRSEPACDNRVTTTVSARAFYRTRDRCTTATWLAPWRWLPTGEMQDSSMIYLARALRTCMVNN